MGNCDSGYSCAYSNSISWRTPSQPNPPEVNPRAVFERLFSDVAGDPATLARRSVYRRSILDYVMDDAKTMKVFAWADRQSQARRVPGWHSGDRAAHRTGGTARRSRRAFDGAARWCSGGICRSRKADVRFDGDGVPNRFDARGDFYDGPRGQHADVSRDRGLRMRIIL